MRLKHKGKFLRERRARMGRETEWGKGGRIVEERRRKS